MALGRVGAYENREAKHLHCIPKEQQPGRISKYTYVTDKYIVGAINRQDDYDPNTRQRWYAHHEQHELDALILADPRAKIFTHHPGSSKEHNRWTGDLGCCCVSTFAWHNVAMSMYDIRNPKEFAYINAHFNRDVMENVSIRGNWVFGEVDELKEKNVKMMRTPVISALAEKLDTVADDAELSALVAAIDNVLDNGAAVSLTGSDYDVSQADWDRVYSARTMIYNNGSEHAMIVNKYTNAMDGVKKFIQYYYSDEGLAKFVNATHCSANANLTDETLVNTSGWTDHEKEQSARSKTNTNVTDGNATSPVFSKTATLHLYGTVDIVGKLVTTNNPQNAAELWTAFKNNVNATTGWATWLKNAGIKG